jgi:hypothetical protein
VRKFMDTLLKTIFYVVAGLALLMAGLALLMAGAQCPL